MKTITKFIRFAEQGLGFELVTWSKAPNGEKSATVEPIVPTLEQRQAIISAPYGEIFV